MQNLYNPFWQTTTFANPLINLLILDFSTHYYPLYPRQLAWLDEKFRWTVLNTVMPRHRVEHCTIQINECEVAFIAGENEEDDDLTYDTIDIYNFKENSWRYGPNR